MYESGATRWFKYGRTDTIRSTTNASLSFVKTMCDPSASVSSCASPHHPNYHFPCQAQQKATALQQAIHAHTEYTNDVSFEGHIRGQGLP